MKIINRVILVIFLSLSFAGKVFSQQFSEDLQLIKKLSFQSPEEFNYYHGVRNNKRMMQVKHHSVIASYNPISLSLKGAMFLYQNVLSEQISKDCPYEVTCSNFCKLSIQHYGIIKGMFFATDRLTRCTVFSSIDVQQDQINNITGKIFDPLCEFP